MSALTMHNVAVVIPALNERLRIRQVVTDALAVCPHVIVVDDGSDDGTSDCIAALPVTVIRHRQRMGKGAALRSGFAQAARMGAQGVLTMDGDGQHRASDFPRMLEAANAYPGWMVNGARLRKRASQPLIRRIGNDFGDWGISWACGFGLIDTQSGQRFYPRKVFTLTNITGEDFVFEAQILICAARRANTRLVSVPVEARYRHLEDGQFRPSHFRLIRDLFKITAHVLGQVVSHGHVLTEYRSARHNLPVIHDPDGEFDTVAATS